MKDFGQWFNEWQPVAPKSEEADSYAWMKCHGCGKEESVSVAAYANGDTGWYVEEDVEAEGDYQGVCGGSDRCCP